MESDGHVRALVALDCHIAAAMLQHHLDVELGACIQRCDVEFRVDDLNIRIGQDIARCDFAFTGGIDDNLLRLAAMQLAAELLEVQNDLCDILLDALDRRKLMQDAINAHGGHRDAGQAGKQHAAHGVTEGRTESALQRLNDKFAVPIRQFHTFELGFFDLYHVIFRK